MSKLNLKWLDRQPTRSTGITWGVPWKKGVLDRHEPISLSDTNGKKTSVQTWPTAFWPDGSVKWTGHAAVLGENPSENYQFQIEKNAQNDHGLQIEESDELIEIDTGKLSCQIHKQGKVIMKQLAVDNNVVASDGKLVAIREEHEKSAGEKIIKQKRLAGEIKSVAIEQSGPVRAVIKVEGVHSDRQNTELFPFIIRLYFYADVADIRIIHTFIYDGDPQIDFIKGLGMEFKSSFTGEAWNRNIQVAGDEGMYAEPGQLILTRRYAGELYAQQIAGDAVDPSQVEGLADVVSQNALWNDFKLIQDSADHYHMTKRTESGCSWVESIHGKRSNGLLYAGGINGGIAVGIKDFWQKHPTSLEVNDLTKEESTIKVWLWSPDSKPMDFRHYSKHTHVESAYEAFDEMRSTPTGIADTSEIYLSCFSTQRTSEVLFGLATDWQEGSLLVCEPHYYYESEALGVWSLPHNESPFMHVLEQQLDQAFQFYRKEIDQRSWYGYWNYGDVMHTYDPVRHQWRYEIGRASCRER